MWGSNAQSAAKSPSLLKTLTRATAAAHSNPCKPWATNRPIDILHGCLNHRAVQDEHLVRDTD